MIQKAMVLGMARSGIAAAKLLLLRGAEVWVCDQKKKEDFAGALDEIEKSGAHLVLGEAHPEKYLSELDALIVSPAIDMQHPLVVRAKELGVEVIGEIEYAYRESNGLLLAVTGTNGKTTTVTLLGEIFKNAGRTTFVVGNIGNPYTEAAPKMTDDAVTVAEISSFQLETIEKFAPKVSAILNITPDHLNRHHTMEEYIRVKELITKNQTESDTCVLNYEDEILREFGKTLRTKVIYFSSLHKLEKGMYLDDGEICYRDENGVQKLCRTAELNLPGRHNHENVMAAAAMALAYGVPLEVIRKVVCAFKAVEHRIEFVTEKNGVVYYNDSKGTNPDAAIKGIQAMDRPTLLIGGGYDKGSSYSEWIQAFDGKVKYLVLIGQTREKIAAEAKALGFTDIVFADSLAEAVQFCADHAKKGDAVLLSPACASWGMFPNYEVRGKMFKELVNNL